MQTQVGQWLVGSQIAQGGMGIVYEARHATIAGDFAVKEIRPELLMDPKARAYFAREADNGIRLRHPNIVHTIEKVELEQRMLLVMERLHGDTLEDVLKVPGENGQPRQWSAEAAVPVVQQIAAGLGYAHSQSVVHRDVKPSNVFIDPNGRVKVLDFGICRILGEASIQSTRSGPPGTPAYMPPEVLLGGTATPAADVFSLGLIFFRMMTGRLPHEVAEESSPWVVVASLLKAYSRDLPRMSAFRPTVPRALDRIVAQMLSVDPLQRPRDGRQVADALNDPALRMEGTPPAGTALGVLGVQQFAQQSSGSMPLPRVESVPSWDGSNAAVPPTPSSDGMPAPSTRLGVAGFQVHRGASPMNAPPNPALPPEGPPGRPMAYGAEPGLHHSPAGPYARPIPNPNPYEVDMPGRGVGGPAGPYARPGYSPTWDPNTEPAREGGGPNIAVIWGLIAAVVIAVLVVTALVQRTNGDIGRPQIPATEGWIEVTSQPTGASIELQYDGRTEMGVAPQTFKNLSTNRGIQPATVWVRMPGYVERRFTVPVVPGLEQHVTAVLQPL